MESARSESVTCIDAHPHSLWIRQPLMNTNKHELLPRGPPMQSEIRVTPQQATRRDALMLHSSVSIRVHSYYYTSKLAQAAQILLTTDEHRFTRIKRRHMN